MATRKAGSRSRQSNAASGNDAARAINESAQKIWLAGLGAFERARAEGPRMFDTLVAQGKGLGGQARDAADQALRSLKESATGASGRFDKLEQVFEERVQRSLKRLGVLTRDEVADLNQGVRDLADQMRELMAQQGAAAKGAATKKGKKRSPKRATRGSRARRA
jgi:poly(hydroxyalkanoate) granule-associated protein